MVKNDLYKSNYQALKKQLSQESITHKIQLRDLTLYWKKQCEDASLSLNALTDEIESLKALRKRLSTKLQQALFSQYEFLNSKNESKNLVDIFSALPAHIPPAGSGDCAAPKLLQYAFYHELQPIAMAHHIKKSESWINLRLSQCVWRIAVGHFEKTLKY